MFLINASKQWFESIIRLRLKRHESYRDKWNRTYFSKKEVI